MGDAPPATGCRGFFQTVWKGTYASGPGQTWTASAPTEVTRCMKRQCVPGLLILSPLVCLLHRQFSSTWRTSWQTCSVSTRRDTIGRSRSSSIASGRRGAAEAAAHQGAPRLCLGNVPPPIRPLTSPPALGFGRRRRRRLRGSRSRRKQPTAPAAAARWSSLRLPTKFDDVRF